MAAVTNVNTAVGCVGDAAVRASDFQLMVCGFDSQPGVIKSPRSTQPSIPPGSVNRVPAFTGWG